MATSCKPPQHDANLDTVQHRLQPISTKPKQPSHAPIPVVLPDSPFQPTSQSHVAALASSLLQRRSSDLALAKATSAPLTHMLPDSPYQSSSNKHITDLARTYTSQANSSSSSPKPRTPHHTPVLPDSGEFQPGSRSHVTKLISQVTGRLQAQENGSGSSSPLAQQHWIGDLPFQLDSKSHVSELVTTFKNTLHGPAGGGSNPSRSAHGATPHNTPLARQPVGTFFTQQLHSSHAEQLQHVTQQPLSSEPANAPWPQIIHLSYGVAAPFKAVPGTSRVAAVASQLEGHNGNDSTSTGCVPGSAACTKLHGTSTHDTVSGDVSTSSVLPTAATPAVSNDGLSSRLLPPSRQPQVVAARLSGITLQGARVALERTAPAEVSVSLASDSGQNMNPLYSASSEGVNLIQSVGI